MSTIKFLVRFVSLVAGNDLKQDFRKTGNHRLVDLKCKRLLSLQIKIKVKRERPLMFNW